MTTSSGLTLPRAGWMQTPMPQPHCYPDTPPPPRPTVRDSRGPPAQYSPECRAHRSTELVHTACGTQELGTSRLMPEKPVQLSEAVRAHAHHLSPGPGGVQDRRQRPYPSHPLAVTGGAQAE